MLEKRWNSTGKAPIKCVRSLASLQSLTWVEYQGVSEAANCLGITFEVSNRNSLIFSACSREFFLDRCVLTISSSFHAEQEGVGVNQDNAAAMQWYQRAAKQVHSRQTSSISIFHSVSSRQNHADATYNMALLFESGKGVGKDAGRAAELLQQASNLGSLQAKNRLANAR